jgi:hypothetical protein
MRLFLLHRGAGMPRSGMSIRRAAPPVTLGVCICRPTDMAAQDSSSDVLRDYIIVKFLADRLKTSPPISSLKTDDGLLNNLKALFKEADLPEPMYMNTWPTSSRMVTSKYGCSIEHFSKTRS